MRGLREPDEGGRPHQGADLSNGRAGGAVRAAGNGLVVHAEGGWGHGYGSHVVLAHRLADGTLVYSVYGHLAPGSVAVRRGQFVPAGRVLGRVGMSGRASSPHLHFEVRVPDDPAVRWEHAAAVDPVAFVRARLPGCADDSTWARPYLEWAECAALIDPGGPGSRALSRGDWWRLLAAASRRPVESVSANTESLRVRLVTSHLLPDRAAGPPSEALSWRELARDLGALHRNQLRLPVSPVPRERRRADCRRELSVASPVREAGDVGGERTGPPSRADVCLALADFAGDPPTRKRARRPVAALAPAPAPAPSKPTRD